MINRTGTTTTPYPHLVSFEGRNPTFWPLRLANRAGPALRPDDPLAFVAPGTLDRAGRLTPLGRDRIDRAVSERAVRSRLEQCVVWNPNSCTWYDDEGRRLDESRPPAAFETHAADLYDLLPLPMEDCTVVELPGGYWPSHLCILRIGPHHVEIAPGGHRTLGVLDEPPIVGRPDPAAAFLDEGGRLRPPSNWRGPSVTSVDDDWTVLGPIQPIGDGVVLRNPSPQRLRRTCDRVAGRRLHDDVHAEIRRTVLDGQLRPMTVSTPEAVE